MNMKIKVATVTLPPNHNNLTVGFLNTSQLNTVASQLLNILKELYHSTRNDENIKHLNLLQSRSQACVWVYQETLF